MPEPLPEAATTEEIHVCPDCGARTIHQNGKRRDMASVGWPIPQRTPSLILWLMNSADCPWCVLRQPLGPPAPS